MYLITFLPCGTKFLVNQSSEEEALKSAVKANETVGEIEDVNLTLKSLYIIEPADFSTLIQLFQKEPYWGNTDDTIIFDDQGGIKVCRIIFGCMGLMDSTV